jgi:hypothetical protein
MDAYEILVGTELKNLPFVTEKDDGKVTSIRNFQTFLVRMCI